VFTKLAQYSFALPALPSSSMLLSYLIASLGSAAGGVTTLNALIGYLPAQGLSAALGTGINLVATTRAEINLFNAGRSAGSTGSGPLDRTATWLTINCNQQSGVQLDDVTGLDGGVLAAVAYATVPGLA
jgi:hypothetical protein